VEKDIFQCFEKGEPMDEKDISSAIVERYTKDLLSSLEVDVAIAGAGPSGLICAYYLAKENIKTAVFEKGLKIGGGMPGGGMMFNKIVFQQEALDIVKEFDIASEKYRDNLYTAGALETISAISYRALKQGARIFNLTGVEDLIIREKKIAGVVINWTAVEMINLHVDPLSVKSKFVVDATGHDCEICRIMERKSGEIKVKGEKSMWAEKAENEILDNTKEVYPGLMVCGMAANAYSGSPRMGAIFGGMFLSGQKTAAIIKKKLA
jgi:sulfide-dependent adenosine diphosphate thiazole synthase